MTSIKTKKCSKCKIEKPISEFHKTGKQNKPRSRCKSCYKEECKKWRTSNPDYNKKYYQQHKLEISQQTKKYRDLHKEEIRQYMKLNRHKLSTHETYRKSIDHDYKLRTVLRSRIYNAINRQYGDKAFSSMELLGCTIEKVRKHLESQFTEGMTWDNHGNYGWHIDHIRPCASFDLTDPKQQKECFHYTNLQPLWAKDNLIKSDKWEEN